MSRAKVELDHDMAAKRRRQGERAKDLIEKSKEVLEEHDKRQGKVSEEPKETEAAAGELKSLRQLLFLGAVKRHVEIDGFVFTLKTLNHKENREVAKKVAVLPNTDRLVQTNILYVAASLQEINGFSISEAYEQIFSEEPDESLDDMSLAFEILSGLNSHVSGKLTEEYFSMSSESRSLLALDKEAEDLKK